MKIGERTTRVDGPAKVRGTATYTADKPSPGNLHYAWIVEASIPKGRVTRLDTTRASQQLGVVAVITSDNAPTQRPYGQPEDAGRFSMSHALLRDDTVRYFGQPIAVTVATSLEAARRAAQLVEASYQLDPEHRQWDGGSNLEALKIPDVLDGGQKPDIEVGDFNEAWAAADYTIDRDYTTPEQASAAMEPHATLAQWDGTSLTIHTSLQILSSGIEALANTFDLDKEQVRIHSEFIGGGFGSKLGIHSDAVLASIASMVISAPVKLVQSRRNVFHNGPHRGASRQRVRLGAKKDGTLTAIAHDARMPMSAGYEFAEPIGATARAAYRCDALHSKHRVLTVDRSPIDSMRGPGEAIGTWALEVAIDELAEAMGRDPVELRLQNLADREPQSGRKFAANDLRRCLQQGAEAFGWKDRPPARSRSRRGDNFVGWGMAACTRSNLLMDASARVRVTASNHVIAEMDMTDIGTGTYTICTQIVADTLNVLPSQVTVRLGDSSLPTTAGSGGSFGAASAGGALLRACESLVDTHNCKGEMLFAKARESGGELTATADIKTPSSFDDLAQYSYGAHFVELLVDAVSGEVRLTRALGAFSFGRILNPLTARSQLIGGMTYGIGGALTESLVIDERYGSFANRDFAEYHLPVQRDIPDLEVLMLGEPEPLSGPLGSKGIGELGLCGIAGAISSAVFHATGVRCRDLPMTPDKILPGLAPFGS